MAAALLPDNGTAWHAFGPIAFFYFIGWLIIGIMMLASWRQKITNADSAGVSVEQAVAKPLSNHAKVRTRAAVAAAFGLNGIIMPGAITMAVVPSYTTVRAFVITAAIIYSTFWLSGGILTLGLRLGWSRRLGWKLR